MKRLKLSFGILFTSLLTLIGCFDLPEEIIMPEWDVDLNVPLFNKRYSVFDMFKPETKHSITSKLNNEDFYLVESEFYVSNSQVTDYVLLSQNSITKNFLLPANAPSQSVYVLFPDGIEINQATFTSGFISFSIENPSPAVITSTLRIPGIHKPDGSELIIERSVSAFSRDSVNYDLANHDYILPPEQSTQNRNSLQIITTANSPVDGTYEIVNFYGYDFKLSSVLGMLPRTSLGNKRTSSSINLNDVADYRGKFFIKEGTINLRSEYVSAHQNIFELEISDIKIVGKRNTGEEKLLTKNDGQNINYRLINGVYDLTLNESNSNLTEFISFLPDSVVITSEYILNPLNDHVTRTVTNHDSIKFAVQFTTKSIFAIKQINYIDTLDIDLSQDDRDKIRDGVAADLNVHLENAIPIDAFVKATLTDEYYSPLFTLTKNQYGVDTLQFLGGQVDNNTGQIISPTVTLNTIKLDSAKIMQLSNARYVIISATLNTKNATNENPNPPTVQFKSSDWLNIKCYGKVKYHIGSEEK